MKNTIKTIITIVILISTMGFTGLKSKKFKIEILQNGESVEIVDNVVELEKKEFQIRITLKKQDGIFMSASYQRDYYDLKENEEIKDYKWLNLKVRAEKKFNGDKELVLDNEIVSYVDYKEMDWHGFDKSVVLKGNKVIGTRAIQKIRIQDSWEEVMLEDLEKDIFLFFIATEDWKNQETPKELGRLKVQLKWK